MKLPESVTLELFPAVVVLRCKVVGVVRDDGMHPSHVQRVHSLKQLDYLTRVNFKSLCP